MLSRILALHVEIENHILMDRDSVCLPAPRYQMDTDVYPVVRVYASYVRRLVSDAMEDIYVRIAQKNIGARFPDQEMMDSNDYQSIWTLRRG